MMEAPATETMPKSSDAVPLYRDSDCDRVVPVDVHDEKWRTPFRRDYARIIHSSSFRRLQGKTQVFPGHESDFFRNRLTHSLEVAQIAEGIVERLNYIEGSLKQYPIDGRLCAAASLVHDLGHPPFGHNGERALDDKMRQYGGFEGNAQTLRILARLEKKETKEGTSGDRRAGLNLCYRTLAAVLKYDRRIPSMRLPSAKLVKGYYGTEAELVGEIKRKVLGSEAPPPIAFKTVECQIMDLADDIAYSVYDLEDCLKAGFLTPADILSSGEDLLRSVATSVSESLKRETTKEEVLAELISIFEGIFNGSAEDDPILVFSEVYRASRDLAQKSNLRTKLSSQLVHDLICAVKFEYNPQFPSLSIASLPHYDLFRVEVLKQYTFSAAIYSPRVKLGEFRGYDVVADLFDALMDPKGEMLLPSDVRTHFDGASDISQKARVVCDFVAGMTDRYAVEFHARLFSDASESMFKPI